MPPNRYKRMNKTKNKLNQKLHTFLLLFFLVFLPNFSFAQNETEIERYVTAKLIPEKTKILPGQAIIIGIDLKIAPKWHVYWINPGDSGLPIKITWRTSEPFVEKEINWPVPDKILYDPLANYGYGEHVTLLQTIQAPSNLSEKPISLEATLNMLVCNDICIPETANISIILNDPNTKEVDNTAIIAEAKKRLPNSLPAQALFSEENSNLIIKVTPESEDFWEGVNIETAEFFPIEWGLINHFQSAIKEINNQTLTLKQSRGETSITKLKSLEGLLTFTDMTGVYHGYAISAKPDTNLLKTNEELVKNTTNVQERNIVISKTQENNLTFVQAILFAFLGGVILNLMPCVFPVISLKALSLIKLSGKQKKAAQLYGIAYSIGVILSFIFVGTCLIALKQASLAIGWGFQLQNPVIVAALTYLLFIIGLNLLGFFEFSDKFSNLGHKLTKGENLISSFFTGVLATIVATPCMAPFMAAALGYALIQSTIIGLSVFASLGLGLSLPYLLLCIVPSLRLILPKPGAWMNTFKQFLAFPMIGFSIWLVSILTQQTGALGVTLVLLGLLFISMAIWLLKLRHKKPIIKALSVIILILPVTFLGLINTIAPPNNDGTSYNFGTAFSNKKLDEALKGDKPIFIEMTAAWCITCKLNHAVAIDTIKTKEIFAAKEIQYMIGDWTNYDKDITEYLEKLGRNGVPIYVYYPPRDPDTKNRPDPLILPQILTTGILEQYVLEK